MERPMWAVIVRRNREMEERVKGNGKGQSGA